jgi:hypothetical protein
VIATVGGTATDDTSRAWYSVNVASPLIRT